jgi:hypothetical protein
MDSVVSGSADADNSTPTPLIDRAATPYLARPKIARTEITAFSLVGFVPPACHQRERLLNLQLKKAATPHEMELDYINAIVPLPARQGWDSETAPKTVYLQRVSLSQRIGDKCPSGPRAGSLGGGAAQAARFFSGKSSRS